MILGGTNAMPWNASKGYAMIAFAAFKNLHVIFVNDEALLFHFSTFPMQYIGDVFLKNILRGLS
jgi:hypothetical protein